MNPDWRNCAGQSVQIQVEEPEDGNDGSIEEWTKGLGNSRRTAEKELEPEGEVWSTLAELCPGRQAVYRGEGEYRVPS